MHYVEGRRKTQGGNGNESEKVFHNDLPVKSRFKIPQLKRELMVAIVYNLHVAIRECFTALMRAETERRRTL